MADRVSGVEPSDLRIYARVESIRMAWEFTRAEAELLKSIYLQLFAVFLAAGVAALASVLLDKFPLVPGFAFAAVMFLFAGLAVWRLFELRGWLRRAVDIGKESIARLRSERGP